MLADVRRKRGKLTEAYDACAKAAALVPGGVRQALAAQNTVLYAWGRFDEALDAIRRFRAAPGFALPSDERKGQAAAALDMGRVEAEVGRAAGAGEHVQEAVRELGDDAKLGFACDSVAAWVFPLRGLPDDSRRISAQVEARLPEFEQDRNTRL